MNLIPEMAAVLSLKPLTPDFQTDHSLHFRHGVPDTLEDTRSMRWSLAGRRPPLPSRRRSWEQVGQVASA